MSRKLWGGNYEGEPDREFWAFNRSFPFDRRLLPQELRASRAWVQALKRCGAISDDESERLTRGLSSIAEKADGVAGYLEHPAEDVHSFVEARLHEEVGDLAGQAHLGRSRNEQTVTALRLFLKQVLAGLRGDVGGVVEALVAQGESGADAVMPGYTHTRPAEPVTFGHLAGAHAWALLRDRDRLGDALRRVDVLPLGSGALAGSALDLDRDAVAAELGFGAVSDNALDAVMDRDFAVESVFACAQLQLHLARLAEDLIQLSSPEYGFVTLPEAFTTGSSLMPQKQNPDALELVRGKSGRVAGDLVSLLTIMKGVPAGYQKDFQEDKEAVFDAVDAAGVSTRVMSGVVAGLRLHPERMRAAAAEPGMLAAGLAVALALDGQPFREAHGVVGGLVAEAQRTGTPLAEVAKRALAEGAPKVAARIDELFDAEAAIRLRRLRGGTAPEAVRASLAAARARLSRD